MTLPSTKRLHPHNRAILGLWGEKYIAHKLDFLGFPNFIPDKPHRGDIEIRDTSMRIEVKTARLGKYGKFRFTLKNSVKSTGGTNLWDENNSVTYVALVIKDTSEDFMEPYIYLIPKSAIPYGKTHIVISSHPTKYKGRYSQYLMPNDAKVWRDKLCSHLKSVSTDIYST